METRKVIIRLVLLSLVAVVGLSCNIDDILETLVSKDDKTVPVDPSAEFQFGYEKEMEVYKGKKKSTSVAFIPWVDEDMVSKVKLDTSVKWNIEYDLDNIVDYKEVIYSAYIKRRDTDWKVRSITISSSDTSLLTISKGEDAFRYNFHLKGVGKCDIDLCVVATDTIRKTYHLKIMDKMTFGIYVNDFWNGGSRCRIRYKCTELPRNIDALTLYIRDSVQVSGICEWYNYDLYGDKAQYVRDTTFYGRKSRYDNYERNCKRLLRNVSPAVRKYNSSKKVTGTGLRYIANTSPAQFDTVKLDYYYKCHFVRLMMDVVCDCPYILFDYYIKNAPQDEVDSDRDIMAVEDDMTSDEALKTYFAVELGVYTDSYGTEEDLAEGMAEALKKYPNDTSAMNAKLDSVNMAKHKFQEENPDRIKTGDEEETQEEK